MFVVWQANERYFMVLFEENNGDPFGGLPWCLFLLGHLSAAEWFSFLPIFSSFRPIVMLSVIPFSFYLLKVTWKSYRNYCTSYTISSENVTYFSFIINDLF